LSRILIGILIGALPFVAWNFWCMWWREWVDGWGGTYYVCNWCRMPFRTGEESDKHNCLLRYLDSARAVLYIVVRHPIMAAKFPFQYFRGKRRGVLVANKEDGR